MLISIKNSHIKTIRKYIYQGRTNVVENALLDSFHLMVKVNRFKKVKTYTFCIFLVDLKILLDVKITIPFIFIMQEANDGTFLIFEGWKF